MEIKGTSNKMREKFYQEGFKFRENWSEGFYYLHEKKGFVIAFMLEHKQWYIRDYKTFHKDSDTGIIYGITTKETLLILEQLVELGWVKEEIVRKQVED